MFVFCLIALAGAYAVAVAYKAKKNQRQRQQCKHPKLLVSESTPTTGVACDDAKLPSFSPLSKLFSMVSDDHNNATANEKCPLIKRFSPLFLQPTDAMVIKDAERSAPMLKKDDSNSSCSSSTCPSYEPTSPPPNYSTISSPHSSSPSANSPQNNMWGETMFSLHLGEDFPSRSSSNMNLQDRKRPIETLLQLETAASRITHQSLPSPPSVSPSEHDPQHQHHQRTPHHQQQHHQQLTQPNQHQHREPLGSTNSLAIPPHVAQDADESVVTNAKKSDKGKSFCRLVRKLTPKKKTAKQRHPTTKSFN
eukprot:m.158403 g.158403  ORF g.158403 m.158403 type:complete len:307 (-) comp31090_c1_seq1:225-1145(-)